jgi:hypothetical protein
VVVAVAALMVAVTVLETVAVMLPRLMRTYISSPKYVPLAVDMRQDPCIAPVLFGAVMATGPPACQRDKRIVKIDNELWTVPE